jgi:hypothetical protein
VLPTVSNDSISPTARLRRLEAYSKGMRQKILLAAALLHNPQLILLDEPLSGLDVNAAIMVKDLIVMLAAQGKTILYSSHILDVVERICDRVLVPHAHVNAGGCFPTPDRSCVMMTLTIDRYRYRVLTDLFWKLGDRQEIAIGCASIDIKTIVPIYFVLGASINLVMLLFRLSIPNPVHTSVRPCLLIFLIVTVFF